MLITLAEKRRIFLTTCAIAICLSLGCRSSVRPLSMFAKRSEPSAEALAGSGPTQTYPAPPSSTVSPNAIASVAGGTSGSANRSAKPGSSTSSTQQVAGFEVSPGYASSGPGPAANMSAAQANGIQEPAQSPSSQTVAQNSMNPANAMTSGYQFGKKSFTPKESDSVANASPQGYSGLGVTAPSTSTSGSVPESTNFAIPSSFTPPSMAASPSSGTSSGQGGEFSGFTLPSQLKEELAFSGGYASSGSASAAAATVETPAASAAAATIAAETNSATPSAMGASGIMPSGNANSGYLPGSTNARSVYPGASDSPSSSGFYR